MFPLIYFVAGILFVRCVLPLLDNLISWFVTYIEKKKGKIAVTLTEYEKEIGDIVGENDAPVTRQIGFVVDDPSEYDTEEEEEEEDV
jgi:hypothetical protein